MNEAKSHDQTTEPTVAVDRRLLTLLHFLEARQGGDSNATQVFMMMRREIDGLRPEEIKAAADYTKELSRELRRLAWALGAGKSVQPLHSVGPSGEVP
jgi:hypothetical protein